MTRALAHDLRRKLDELELALFTGEGLAPGDVTAAAGALADQVDAERARRASTAAAGSAEGAGARMDDSARERVRALSEAAAFGKDAYRARFGVCGVRPFESASGVRIYLLPIETLPNHVNNVYLILSPAHSPLLFDAGSGIGRTREDFARAARVLTSVYGEGDVLGGVRDVVVSHGHIDHFGGVGFWRERGARLHVHEHDLRVLTNFTERIVVSTLSVRAFWHHAGVPEEERAEMEQMYVGGKNFFQPVPVEHVLTDGARVFDYIAHHAPGHCPGQICMQIDNILLTADHVLPRITPHQSPESITPSTGLDHYLESLDKVRRIAGIDLALPGHEEPMDRLYQRITEIVTFHRRRLEKVRLLCAGGQTKTVREIALALFGPRVGYDRILALQEAGAHVEYLARRGILEIENVEALLRERDPVLHYRAAASAAIQPAPGDPAAA